MTRITPGVRTFRDQIATAAESLHPADSLRVLAKGRAPLSSQGDTVGQLAVLLRMTFQAGQAASGVLVFQWPEAAKAHSVVRLLEAWGAGERPAETTIKVETKAVPVGDATGTQLKVGFVPGEFPDRLLELLQLADRLGVTRAALAQLEPAMAAAPKPTAAPAAVAVAMPTSAPAKPVRHLDPAEQAKVEAIQPQQIFDAQKHPSVAINDEVTNAAGVTYRLSTKRLGGRQRRVWIRVSGRRAAG